MSKIALAPNANGTGTFTLSAPNGNTSRTMVLPDADGTLLTTESIISSYPAGSVVYHAANSAPTGFIKANGATVSRTTYADLFASIGTLYGAGDGSSTFEVPDLRGEFARGFDDGRGVDTSRTFGSSQSEEVGPHRHFVINTNNQGNFGSWVNLYIAKSNTNGGSQNYSLNGTNVEPTVGLTSEGTGTETRPRNVALLACIKF